MNTGIEWRTQLQVLFSLTQQALVSHTSALSQGPQTHCTMLPSDWPRDEGRAPPCLAADHRAFWKVVGVSFGRTEEDSSSCSDPDSQGGLQNGGGGCLPVPGMCLYFPLISLSPFLPGVCPPSPSAQHKCCTTQLPPGGRRGLQHFLQGAKRAPLTPTPVPGRWTPAPRMSSGSHG